MRCVNLLLIDILIYSTHLFLGSRICLPIHKNNFFLGSKINECLEPLFQEQKDIKPSLLLWIPFYKLCTKIHKPFRVKFSIFSAQMIQNVSMRLNTKGHKYLRINICGMSSTIRPILFALHFNVTINHSVVNSILLACYLFDKRLEFSRTDFR